MCGRFALDASRYEVAEQFHVDEVAEDSAPDDRRFNVAPSQEVLAVASSRDGTVRRLGTFRWGLVPGWASDPSIGNRMINARAETAPDKPAFRRAFERRRCLLPASGYYEWKSAEGGRRRKASKVPYYFRRRDGLLLAIGGLWEVWHGDGDDEVLRTCTVLTTRANALGAEVHDRMPLLVPEHLWDRWLAPEPLTEEERLSAIAPAPEELLVAIRVSDAVNDPRNDGPELAQEVDAHEADDTHEVPDTHEHGGLQDTHDAEPLEATTGEEGRVVVQALPIVGE